MNAFKLQLFFFGLVAAAPPAICGCPYLYYNPLSLDQSIAIYKDSRTVIFGSVGSRVSFCDERSSFICIAGNEFVFSFPKSVADYPDGWDYGDTTFEVIASSPFYKASGEETIYIVRASREKSHLKTLFSFSYRSGLLGIGMRDSSGSRIGVDVFIDGGVGYGADREFSDSCVEKW